MIHTIKDNNIEVRISTKGAELQSIKNTKINHEFLWQGDPQFWTGRAPILFPIVGGLKNKEYLSKGIKYSMPNHGVVRTSDFTAQQISEQEVCFTVVDNEETKQMYPFSFEMKVCYKLENNKIFISHTITNTSSEEMPFVFGLHPAFNLDDKLENTSLELLEPYRSHIVVGRAGDDFSVLSNRYLDFKEPLISTIDTKDGFIISKTKDYGFDNLIFNEHSFDQSNTIIFDNLTSRTATLHFKNSERKVRMTWNDDLPILAIWSKAGSSFICIEPWCSWGDNDEDTINELKDKKGMIMLAPSTSKEFKYTIEIF